MDAPAPSATAASGGLTSAQFSRWLAGCVAVAFAGVLLGWESFYFRDFGIFGLPLAWHHREAFWNGEVPLWNPLSHCGVPFLAQWNTLVLYPGSLLYLLLPLPWSLNVFCLAHLVLAGVGMQRLAARWTGDGFAAALAGLAFALNGATLSSLKWPHVMAALGWMPWVVLTAPRAWAEGGRRLAIAAGVGALQMLTGTPEIILFTWVLVLGLGLVALIESARRRPDGAAAAPGAAAGGTCGAPWRLVGRALGLVALVAGLAAAQLLPFFELLAGSQRGPRFESSAWPLPWWGWANFLVPVLRCFASFEGVFTQPEQYWLSTYYVSLGVLGLALWGAWRVREPRVWVLTGLAALALLLALGDAGGGYAWLRRIFPPLGWMRFPVKFIVVPIFVFPLVAACGAAELRRRVATRGVAALRGPGALALALTGAIGLLLVWARLDPLPQADWPQTVRCAAGRVLCLALGAAAWLGLARGPGGRTARWAQAALLLLVPLDVFTHAPWQNPTVPPWVYDREVLELEPRPRVGEARAMVSAAAEYRLNHWLPPDATQDIMGSRLGLFANCNLIDGVPKVDGFYALIAHETERLQRLLYRDTNALYAPLLDFLGVTHITAPGELFKWQPRPTARPLLTAGQRPVFAEADAILRALAADDFAPDQVVYLPAQAAGSTTVTHPATARVSAPRVSRHRWDFDVHADAPAWVVLAQSFDPHWRAEVDGQPVRLWPANVAFQALEVPAGRHTVSLRYVDRAFQVGTVLTLLSLAVCGGLLGRARGRLTGPSDAR